MIAQTTMYMYVMQTCMRDQVVQELVGQILRMMYLDKFN